MARRESGGPVSPADRHRDLIYRTLRQGQRVLHVDTQISDRIFDFGVAQQYQYRADFARGPIDHCGLGPLQRVRTIFRLAQSDRRHPPVQDPDILPCAQGDGMVHTAREEIVAS